MGKKITRLFSFFIAVCILAMFSLTSMASNVSESDLDLTLLETEAHPNAGNIETRKERHERLIAEGYVLEDIKESSRARTLYITGPDGNLYETRIATSTYRQPNKTTVTYGEEFLNVITQSTLSRLIEVAVGFVDYVGWIPSALGINSQSLADFLSRGRVTHICDSTLFFYDIEVKPAGTNRYYFVASSEKYAMAVTATSSGFTQLGTPVQKTVSGFAESQSENYENERALSEIAVDYFVTGGPNYTYTYFEEYDIIDYIELN